MLHFWSIVRDVTFVAVWFGVPFVVFLPRMKRREDIGKRMVISTLVTWVALVLHLWFVHLPVAYALAEARGNKNYDGAAASSMTELFGWVFGLISTAVAAIGYLLIQYARQRREKAG